MTSTEAGNGYRRGGTEPFDTGGPGWGVVGDPGPARAHDLDGTYGWGVTRGRDSSGGPAPLGRQPVDDGARGDVGDPQGSGNSGSDRGGRAEPSEDDAQRTSWERGDGFNADTQMVALGSSRRAPFDDGWPDDVEPPGARMPRHGGRGAVSQDRSTVDRQGEGSTPGFGADVDSIEDDGPLVGSPGGDAGRSTGFRYTSGPGIDTDFGAPQTGPATTGPVASAAARNPVGDGGGHGLATAEPGNAETGKTEPGVAGVRAEAALGTGPIPRPRLPVAADDPLTGSIAGGGDEIGGVHPGRDVYRVPENDGSGHVGLAQGDEPAAVEGRRGRRAAPDADHEYDDGPLGPGDVAETRIRVWGDEAIGGYRAEWHEVKAQFVDDPVTALARAHDLLTEAVHELSDALLAERDELDPLRRTAPRDTETMRVAMRGYREFLDRILAL